MTPSARRTTGGYRAVLVHDDGRVEPIGRPGASYAAALDRTRLAAGRQFERQLVAQWRGRNRDEAGRPRSEAEARTALGLDPAP
ncbi:hypothetical protein [Thalassobaculum sp.]|uniref:hypothetical protein n=1 Tax=Thalassobaculum sp. TaxID=2022740 RepID=UPI0032ED8C6F